jgi:N-acetyl-anhydromuramyl-L-alanine amidase AmpD
MPTPPWFPVQPPTQGKTNEILIMGQRFELGATDIDVRTYAEPGTMSFYAVSPGNDGMPMFGYRYEKPGLKMTTIEQLFEHVHQIIIHTDLTNDSAGCFRALAGRSLSSHFLIDWDGVLWQPLDAMDCGYHAGEGNNKAIGLDFNNRLPNLEREPNEPPYSPTYSRIDEVDQKGKHKRPVSDRMEVNGAKVRSYGYTDPQYATLVELFKVLTKRFKNMKAEFPVDPKGEVINRTLDEAIAHQGFMAHWHWELQRWDPGPGFDWQRVFHALGNEHNSFPIELETGKNIRSLLEPTKVKDYAESYFKNNETQTHGWYPMGINQTWHGGIHLAAPRGTPVRAITDGVLVAARFGRQATKLGSNNFVLLKHTVPIPAKKKGAEPKKFVFYSLYMHLDCIDTVTLNDPEIPWLKELTRIDKGKEDAEKRDDDEPKEEPKKKDAAKPAEEEASDEGEEEVLACDMVSKDLWLDVGVHTAALKRGMVAKIAYQEDPIYVLSGQVLGRIGMFGPEGDWKPQVHVEVFADTGWKEAIDIGVHGKFLIELDDDVGQNLFVENPDVISLFGSPRRRQRTSLVPEKILDQATIESFWMIDNEYLEEKRYLRKLVVRHVSEWSDKVDWVESLSKADDWDGKISDFRKITRGTSIAKDAIATVLPFTWLSKDVAEHIGLDVKDWRGLLDHFHPIHFLMWLTYNSTQRVQTLSSSTKSPREVKRKAAQAEKEAERCRTAYKDRLEAQRKMEAGDKNAEKCFSYLTDEDRGESTVSISEFEEVPEVELMNEWMGSRDQGEWKQVVADEDDY